jgi:hypothetical protein
MSFAMTLLDQISMTLEIPVTLRMAIRADLSKLEWYGQYTHYRQLFRRTFRDQEAGRRLMLVGLHPASE